MDFDTCFKLLAARPAHAHAHCEHAAAQSERQHGDADVQALADALKTKLGSPKHQGKPATADSNSSAEAHDMPALADLSASALVQAFFRLQEARVQIYSEFQKGFDVHQQTAYFAEFSTGITARFAAVSSTINRIEQTLIAQDQRVLAQYIRKVQLEEKEKLLMTSALLVEKMRLRDAQTQREADASITSLLEASVATLSRKHAAIIERINDLLDELRSEAVDFDDDEQ